MELNQAFSAFLSTTNGLGGLERIELYKTVLGCFSDLREVADREYWTLGLEQAVRTLEICSAECVQRVLIAQDGESE